MAAAPYATAVLRWEFSNHEDRLYPPSHAVGCTRSGPKEASPARQVSGLSQYSRGSREVADPARVLKNRFCRPEFWALLRSNPASHPESAVFPQLDGYPIMPNTANRTTTTLLSRVVSGTQASSYFDLLEEPQPAGTK